MTTFVIDDDAPILVEFTPRAPQPGTQEVMRGWPPTSAAAVANIAEQSAKAIDSAMNTIRGMARRVSETVKSLPITERPSTNRSRVRPQARRAGGRGRGAGQHRSQL